MGRVGRIFVVFLIAAGAGAVWYRYQQPGAEAIKPARAAAAIPVTTAVAGRSDLPIYLTGLGAVQASFTVGIKPQVDGKLEQVLFTEGQQVKRGDVLARIDPRPFQAVVDQAKAKKLQDEALLSSAQKDLVRSKTLVDKSFQTQQVVDQQQARVDQLIASISADEAMIEGAQTNLDYTSIVAPSDGRMGVRNIDPGNIVHPADAAAIAALTLTRPSAVLFTLSSRSLTDVREAMARGAVEVTAFDQDNVHELSRGTLLLIDNFVDQASATMRLKAMFANQDDRLWPGDFVNARVLLEVRKNVLTVPSPSIQRGPDGLFVWVIKPDGSAEARTVTVGAASGDRTIVTAGITDGERVVVNGQYKLRPGSKVAVTDGQPPAAKKDPST